MYWFYSGMVHNVIIWILMFLESVKTFFVRGASSSHTKWIYPILWRCKLVTVDLIDCTLHIKFSSFVPDKFSDILWNVRCNSKFCHNSIEKALHVICSITIYCELCFQYVNITWFCSVIITNKTIFKGIFSTTAPVTEFNTDILQKRCLLIQLPIHAFSARCLKKPFIFLQFLL